MPKNSRLIVIKSPTTTSNACMTFCACPSYCIFITTTCHDHTINKQTRQYNPTHHNYHSKQSRDTSPTHPRNTLAPRALTPTTRAAHTPTNPLTLLELYGGTATDLEALLKAEYHIKIYFWANTGSDAHTSLQHRITQMREISTPTSSFFHCPLEYPTPTRYHSNYTNRPANKLFHMHRRNNSQRTHLPTDLIK
jgi:hypothetical protein